MGYRLPPGQAPRLQPTSSWPGAIRHSGCVEEAIAVLRTADARVAMAWYQRLGYEQEWEYRFEPGFPAFVSLSRMGAARLFLSEHTGDARPDTLVCLRVDDLEAVACEFHVQIAEQPWGRELQLSDPDGNRLRVSPTAASE